MHGGHSHIPYSHSSNCSQSVINSYSQWSMYPKINSFTVKISLVSRSLSSCLLLACQQSQRCIVVANGSSLTHTRRRLILINRSYKSHRHETNTSISSKASGMVFADGLTAIAARTVEKIQKAENIDLTDLLPGQLHNPDIPPLIEHLMYHPYAPSIPARKKEINSPAQWALAFSTYISIVIDKEPGRA